MKWNNIVLLRDNYYHLMGVEYNGVTDRIYFIEINENRGIVSFRHLDAYLEELMVENCLNEPLESPVELDDMGATKWREDNL